jgi:hypothetical protein
LKAAVINTTFLTSIAVAVLFLTKYNFGLLLIAAIVLMEYLNLPDKDLIKRILVSFVKEVLFIKKSNRINISLKSVFPSNIYFLFIPALLCIVIWLIYPYPHKINSFLSFAMKTDYLSQTSTIPFFSLNNFLLYPKIINEHYSISQGIFIITAILFISSFFKTSDIRIKTLRNFFLIGLFLSTLHSLKEERFIFTILPAYWTVAAYQANKLIMNINLNILRNNAVLAKTVFLALVFALSFPGYGSFRTELQSGMTGYYGDKELKNVLDYIADTVNKKNKMILFGSFNEFAPDLIIWELSGERGFPFENIRVELQRFDRKSHYLDPSGMPDKYAHEFNRWMGNPESDYVVTIEVLRSSKYFSEDYKKWNSWKMNYIYLMENNQNKYSVISKRFFNNLGLIIKIYRKTIS